MVFTKNFCDVIYNNKVILRGTKDPSSDLWMLLLNASEDMLNMEKEVGEPHTNPPAYGQPQIVAFTHSVQTQANAVKFAHQLLCNPKFSMLLKATHRGFLMGCLNINKNMILKYLNPSPATAKEHMKRPRHGKCSTTPKMPKIGMAPTLIIPVFLPPVLPLFQQPPPYQGPVYGALQSPNLFGLDDDESIANISVLEHLQIKTIGWCTII